MRDIAKFSKISERLVQSRTMAKSNLTVQWKRFEGHIRSCLRNCMDNPEKKIISPHTNQQSAEKVAEMRSEKVVGVQKVIEEERVIYETLLRERQELFGALETAKRNKNSGIEAQKSKRLD